MVQQPNVDKTTTPPRGKAMNKEEIIKILQSKHDAYLGTKGEVHRSAFKSGLAWAIDTIETITTQPPQSAEEFLKEKEIWYLFSDSSSPFYHIAPMRIINLLDEYANQQKQDNKCPRCKGTGEDGFDRCVPPNPYVCEDCNGTGINH